MAASGTSLGGCGLTRSMAVTVDVSTVGRFCCTFPGTNMLSHLVSAGPSAAPFLSLIPCTCFPPGGPDLGRGWRGAPVLEVLYAFLCPLGSVDRGCPASRRVPVPLLGGPQNPCVVVGLARGTSRHGTGPWAPPRCGALLSRQPSVLGQVLLAGEPSSFLSSSSTKLQALSPEERLKREA